MIYTHLIGKWLSSAFLFLHSRRSVLSRRSSIPSVLSFKFFTDRLIYTSREGVCHLSLSPTPSQWLPLRVFSLSRPPTTWFISNSLHIACWPRHANGTVPPKWRFHPAQCLRMHAFFTHSFLNCIYIGSFRAQYNSAGRSEERSVLTANQTASPRPENRLVVTYTLKWYRLLRT
jgi:hypothetical protein